jgi:hypothetical protein
LRSKKQKNANTHSYNYLQFMSLNNIQLTAILTAEMYKNLLVEKDDGNRLEDEINQQPGEATVKTTTETAKGWKYLGDFKKKILILVDYSNAVHIPDEDLNFLTSILSASRLNLADVAVLNLANANSRLYKDVQQQFKSEVTVLFGLGPKDFEMPVNFPEFQVQPFSNCVFLCAPAIENIAADKLLKSKLWICLKKIFNL